METITLNDGTVFNGHCIESAHNLYITLYDTSLVDGFTAFSNEEKTSVITQQVQDTIRKYEGYTQLDGISKDEENCNLVLSRQITNTND